MNIAAIAAVPKRSGRLVQLLVEVTADDGATGVGECWWGVPDAVDPLAPYVATIDSVLAPRYLGRDVMDLEGAWQDAVQWAYRYGDDGILLGALSGIDLALWDLKGKTLGTSVLNLLGGRVADRLPAYASLPPLRDPEVLVHETRRAVEHGFTAVKLHELDPALTELTRREFGEDLGIMVDVNGHYDYAEAMAAGRRLAAAGVVWFEEPVWPMRDHAAMRRLRDDLGVPIAAGENEFNVASFERLIDSGGVDYVQPEITKIGGLTAARKISALVEASPAALCPHNFRLGPSFDACLHWGFSSAATRWLEVPWMPEGVTFPSGDAVPAVVDGSVAAPTGPGLGRGGGQH